MRRGFRSFLGRVRRDEGGFTLPELLVTCTMLIVVLFSLYGIFDSGIRVFSLGNNKVEATENARIGLEKMSREVRAAYPQNNAPLLVVHGTDEIRFRHSGVSGIEEITYKLDGSNLTRNGEAVISDVNSLTFKYMNGAGGETSTESEIERVGIALVVKAGESEQNLTTEVRLRNRGGTTLPGPAPSDSTPPTVTITSGPAEGSSTTETAAEFEFFASESGSTFECSLNSAAFAPCAPPTSYTNISAGANTFAVRATDTAGNLGPSATRTWTVSPPADTTPPDTSITDGPASGSSTTNTSSSFRFESTESGSTFECRLDGGSWQTCTSPKDYTGLAVGSHTFSVRATDAAGNTDSSPASRTWTVAPPADTTPPDTTITSGPSGTVNPNSASFAFTSTESGSTFQCRLDGGTWESCDSPRGYTGLANGNHTFEVRATDAAGNTDPSPASRTWTIQNRAPRANADSYTLKRGQTHEVSAANGLLANDTDPDNDAIRAVSYNNPSRGTLTLRRDGSFTFTSAGNTTTGNVTFTYNITDDRGGTSSATVTINITR